jgi:hypothetical protein
MVVRTDSHKADHEAENEAESAHKTVLKAKTELQKAKDLQAHALKSNDPKDSEAAHKQIIVAKNAEAAAHCAQGKAEASAHAAAK